MQLLEMSIMKSLAGFAFFCVRHSGAFFTSYQIGRDSSHGLIQTQQFSLGILSQKNFLTNVFENAVREKTRRYPVSVFFEAWNERDLTKCIDQFGTDAIFEDASYPAPFCGKDDINRHFRLLADTSSSQFILDEIAIDDENHKIAAYYHVEDGNGNVIENSRHITFFTMDGETGVIKSAFDTVEPANKAGEINLRVLSFVSKFLESTEESNTVTTIAPSLDMGNSNKKTMQLSTPERFFDAFNRRDINDGIELFKEDCLYDDTVFPSPLQGKEALRNHLELSESCLPSTFSFVVDDLADGGETLGVRWHVENEGKEMPFTRGSSFYRIDKKTGLVETVVDEIEPAVLKIGGLKTFMESFKNKIVEEPVRLIPFACWIAYMYIVFISDGILPGANALQLEQRTWEEVRDLSLNFFFVSPILNLPFAPTVHPILEGVFNLLLSWAALFAGFLSDDREEKPNLFPMIPAVVGMQFLTSAFLLPYLTFRTSERDSEAKTLTKADLSDVAKVVESKLFGLTLGTIGTGSLAWGTFARMEDYGNFNERVTTFWQLMSIDRVGSSFLVDLAIFALFQGWLVDDDLKRRGIDANQLSGLRNIARYVPFFGLAAYLVLRPSFPEES
mmetsp:Transcript_8442/g.13021  ORF Transcript_8442/g.13021 Transcript_8442/m.13021 type:complete len:617 (-) Transcript_8442:46-1896(-)